MAAAAVPLALQIIQIVATAEPAVINAISNLLHGTGTMDDLKVLKADRIAWQALADHAAAQIAAAR